LSKSASIADREFNFAHTKTNPPSMESFISDCDHLLSSAEISRLRDSNILFPNE